jgi:hypothetical protein
VVLHLKGLLDVKPEVLLILTIHYKKLKEKKKNSNCRHNPFNSGIPLIENIA